MREREIADETPDAPRGFRRIEHAGGRALVRDELARALEQAGLLEPGGLLRRLPVRDTYQGRGTTAIVEVAGVPLVVRRFLPGGLLRRFRGPTFRRWRRPFRELELLLAMHRAGLPALDPVAAVARRRGRGFELELITRQLRDARELLQALNDPALAGRSRRRVLEAAGRELAAFHAAGFEHADLHLKNFLVADGRVLIIDLDRSRTVERVADGARLRNLTRLWRYAERRARFGALAAIRPRDVVAFLRGYAPAREDRRRWLAAVRRRHAWTRPLHACGWWFEGRPPERASGGEVRR